MRNLAGKGVLQPAMKSKSRAFEDVGNKNSFAAAKSAAERQRLVLFFV